MPSPPKPPSLDVTGAEELWAAYERAIGARASEVHEEQRTRAAWARDQNATGRGCRQFSRRCEAARNMKMETPECCKRHIRTILADVGALLDDLGVTWWADYGTLLGALRHGGLIPWDKDADLGILAEDRAKLLSAFPLLLSVGYYPTYAPPKPNNRFRTGDRVKVRLSQRNHTNTDIFIWEKRPDGMLDRINYIGADLFKGRSFPESWLYPIRRADFDGIDIALPAEAEKLVEHRYGPGWTKPERTKHPAEVRGDWWPT